MCISYFQSVFLIRKMGGDLFLAVTFKFVLGSLDLHGYSSCKNHIQDKYQPHRTEWRIFDEDKNLAGTVDMVYEKENGELFIFDWKRSKKIINSDGSIEKNNPFENGLNGLSHLPSSDYVKYCLQQNIYKNILESKYDKKVSSMNLLILHPHLENYHIIQVESFKNETKYLLDSI